MKTSKVKGCFWSLSHRVWFARTRGRRVLYRGQNQTEAEDARIDYNKTRTSKGHADARTLKGRFGGVRQPIWPISRAFEKRGQYDHTTI